MSVDYTSQLWEEINDAIRLRDCLVYSYISDMNEDPLSEGQMSCCGLSLTRSWSFNYFFYNKELKKVLFIACTARRFALSLRMKCSAFQTSESFNLFPTISQEEVMDDSPIDM